MTVGTEEEYKNFQTLERLPIPPLEATLKRYIDRTEPLLGSEEAQKTKQVVYSESNLEVLSYLQDKLLEYENWLATFEPQSSYIEQFWYNAYLMYDSPVVLNVNPFFELEDDPTLDYSMRTGVFQEYTLQIKRASRVVTSALRFASQIRNNTLKPDILRNDVPLSMDQYQKLFGSSRIPPKPKQQSCHLQTDSTSHHIVIMYKGSFYWFDVLDCQNELIFQSAEEIEWNLYSIIMDRERLNKENHKGFLEMGILTTESRRTWANIREHIHKQDSRQNWQNLKIIDSALFVLCLDDYESHKDDPNSLLKLFLTGTSEIDFNSPFEIDEYVHAPKNLQRGTCINRWFDKLQIIVTKCGKAGVNFEHTGVDGHTVLRLANEIYTDAITSFAQTVTSRTPRALPQADSNLITVPRKLEWLKDEYLCRAVHFAEVKCTDLISQYEIESLEFGGYGSARIKSIFKCSPDAFVQQMFQVAFYALYGTFETIYEPAMTKTFLNGRTEAIRPVTHDSIKFVKSVFNHRSTDTERIDLLHRACQEHTRITRECSMGMGQDRHLYALQCIWQKLQAETPDDPITHSTPPIFEDNAWHKINKNILSTSNCGSPALKWFGFGPVDKDGFGIGYIIKDSKISVTVSSRHRQTARFITMLDRALNELDTIFNRAPKTI